MTSPARSARIGAEVRRLAGPAIAHQLLQTLVFVVDRLVLGRHSEGSLAAMQIAGPLEWAVWSVFSAFTVGTIARVGLHVGAGRIADARRAARASLILAVALGALVAAVAVPLLPLLGALAPHASPSVVVAARAYLLPPLLASPVVFFATAGIAILQASGDTRTPLAIGVLANAVHVVLLWGLVLGVPGIPPLGPLGAGLATALSFGLMATLALRALLGPRRVSLRGGDGRGAVQRAALLAEGRAVLAVAAPSLIERVVYHIGYTAFVAMIALLGDTAMAANQALISVESVCFLSADGFGVAAASLVAQKLGAGKPDEAAEVTRASVRYAATLLAGAGLLFLLTRGLILPLFTGTEGVRAASAAVPVIALAQPFMATGVVVADALRGGAFTRAVLRVNAFTVLVVRLGSTYLFALALGWGLKGVWMGSTADWVVRTVLLVLVARRISRQLSPPVRPA